MPDEIAALNQSVANLTAAITSLQASVQPPVDLAPVATAAKAVQAGADAINALLAPVATPAPAPIANS